MGEILKRLAKRDPKEAEEALKRLDQQSEKGPDAFRRFKEAARRFVSAPRDRVSKRDK